MELAIGLIILLVVVFVLILPVVVMVRLSALKEEVRRLWEETQNLRVQCTELTRRLAKVSEARRADEPSRPVAEEFHPRAEASEVETLDRMQAVEKPDPVVETKPAASIPPVVVPPPLPVRVQPAVVEAPKDGPRTGPAMPGAERPLRPQVPVRQLPARKSFNWEHFMGVKLVAWLGGFALFLAAAYFVKYSFEHNLIPPQARVAIGYLLGLGLVFGGWATQRKSFKVTSQTLTATGVVILYAVTFACRAVYQFPSFTPGSTFFLLALVTGVAFGLAIRMEAPVVAVLGMLAGFLTPVVISTGKDNPVGLFGYIALLNLGLIAVAGFRPWRYLLPMAAVGTILMELGWAAKFLNPEKLPVAFAVHAFFPVLFLGASEWKRRRSGADHFWDAATLMVGMAGLFQAFLCVGSLGYAERYVWLGGLLLVADLVILLQLSRRPEWWVGQILSGAAAYLWMAVWMGRALTEDNLHGALGLIFLIALVHCGHAAWFMRRHPQSPMRLAVHGIAPLALGMVLVPIFKFSELSLLIWPLILLVDVMAVVLAVITGVVWSVVVVLLMTVVVAGCWVFEIPSEVGSVPWAMVIAGGMAAGFFFASIFVMRRMAAGGGGANKKTASNAWMEHLPALSAMLPFLLLIMVMARLPILHPSSVFALAMALIILLLSVARTFRQHALLVVGLLSVIALQWVWMERQWVAGVNSLDAVLWLAAFSIVFLVYPFVSRSSSRGVVLPWAVAALSLPLHFGLIYRVVQGAWPNNYMGLLPAILSLPLFGCTGYLSRSLGVEDRERLGVLAWFGGAALFFVTLVFPIQFERQWITVAWALEGAALCWLFHRIPHPGLRLAGVGLLVVSFVRLTLNPAVLGYHPRSATPILNWYLYAYGITIVALCVGARLLAPPRDRWRELRFPPLLSVLATVLSFILVNIEIADYFTAPGEAVLTFQFSGNLARDMSYTIAWALFALGLVFYGLRRPLRAARRAGLVLLVVTLVKLFFHDLAELAQLYRIGALAVVAVIAILASFLYQRFLVEEGEASRSPQERTEPPKSA